MKEHNAAFYMRFLHLLSFTAHENDPDSEEIRTTFCRLYWGTVL